MADMKWAGKLAGAALGMITAGPVGAVVGALVGHQFDRGWRMSPLRGDRERRRELPPRFLQAAFEVMGHVAKADGRVSETDIEAARAIMRHMQLSPAQVRQAIGSFTVGKQPGFPLQRTLDDLYAVIGNREALCRGFVELQMEAALSGGGPTRSQRALLWQVASTLGINRIEFAQLEQLLGARRGFGRASAAADTAAALAAAYRLLDVPTDATDAEVKKAYRRLMNRHHPDKLAASGQPESMQEIAKERTREIRAAYDRIRAHRGLH